MGSAFDSTNYPNVEPEIIRAGDYIAWKRTDLATDYPVASYALTYTASKQGSTKFNITASESSSPEEYLVEVGGNVSAAYSAGEYNWQADMTDSSDSTKRVQVGEGLWTVEEDLAISTADPRTHNQKVLDAIRAVIQNRATRDQSSYSISGRSLSLTPMEDLLTLQAEYEGRVLAEVQKQRIANGQATGNSINVRFIRA